MVVAGVEADDAMPIDFRRSAGSIGDVVEDWERVYLCLVGLTHVVDITKLGFLDVEVEPELVLGLSNLLAADVEIVRLAGLSAPDDVLVLTVSEFTVYLDRTMWEAGPVLNSQGEAPEEVLGRTSDREDVEGMNGLSLDGINVGSESIWGFGQQDG